VSISLPPILFVIVKKCQMSIFQAFSIVMVTKKGWTLEMSFYVAVDPVGMY